MGGGHYYNCTTIAIYIHTYISACTCNIQRWEDPNQMACPPPPPPFGYAENSIFHVINTGYIQAHTVSNNVHLTDICVKTVPDSCV